jgi:hypothetical protein
MLGADRPGPMSKCSVCGRTGLIGKEREIVGAKAVTVYKCHGCDNEWRVVDQPAQAPPPFSGHNQSAPRGPARVSSRAISPRAPGMLILSAGRAEAYQPHRTEVCISITDPKASEARLSPKFKAVLRLSFTDISAPTEHPGHVRFGDEHAQAILDFIDEWRDVDRIVIHCVAGLSRSPAVGLALSELRGWPLQRMNADYPNPWVRSELVRIGRLPKAHPRSSSKKTRKSSSARRRA